MDEAALQDKLRKIEALHAGTTSDGEREAARLAAERIRARLAEVRAREPDVELVYTLPDPWTRKLFLALCRRYGLKPFRRFRQRYTTVQVVAPATFQQKIVARVPCACRGAQETLGGDHRSRGSRGDRRRCERSRRGRRTEGADGAESPVRASLRQPAYRSAT